jgi:uncharacterized protein YcbX
MKRAPMLVGTIDGIRRYPVKSLRGEELDCAEVGWSGIPGDRASAFFVLDGNPRVGKPYRGKEHERLHLTSDPHAAHSAANDRGVEVELRAGDHFFDAAPISIVLNRWLDDLSDEVGYAVEWERFRPNFFVRAATGFAVTENDLVGADLRLGTVRMRVRAPIERCVTITYHPRGEASDPRILRFIAERRNAKMGIYCEVLEPGRASLGDSLVREAPLHS